MTQKPFPLLTVPMMGADEHVLLREAAQIAAHPAADMAEWRADAFAAPLTGQRIRQLVPALRDALQGKPLLFTLRTEGSSIKKPDYAALLLSAAQAQADWVDVETLSQPEGVGLVSQLHALGSRVLASCHCFEDTPAPSALLAHALALRASGADAIKLAAMARTPQEVEIACALCRVLARQATPYTVISMGEAGLQSRLLARKLGCMLSFCSMGQPSAAGQIPLEAMARWLKDANSQPKG